MLALSLALSQLRNATSLSLSRVVSLSRTRDCNVHLVHTKFLDVSSGGSSDFVRSLSWPVLFVVAVAVCLLLIGSTCKSIRTSQIPIPIPIPEFSTYASSFVRSVCRSTCPPPLPALPFCAWTRLHFTCAL